MKIAFISAALAAALSLAGAVNAQQPEQAPAPPPGAAEPAPAPTDVSDEEIDTFATIYVELQEMAAEYEQEISTVESEQEAQEVQTRMQLDSIETLERHGWTPDRFNRVAEALNQNPQLTEKALRAIEEKS